MSLKVGDRVRVQSEEFADQNGLAGIIISLTRGVHLNVTVEYHPGQKNHPYLARYCPDHDHLSNCYGEVDLILDDNYLMEDHEFTLDEILQSKELIEGIEHDRRRNQ